jgi:hypothetical protein
MMKVHTREMDDQVILEIDGRLAGAFVRELESDTDNIEMERAFLAIDVSPQCAVLLSALEDAGILMDRTLSKATMGWWELPLNPAWKQDWRSASSKPYVLSSEVQHA